MHCFIFPSLLHVQLHCFDFVLFCFVSFFMFCCMAVVCSGFRRYPLFQSHLKGTIEGVSADMIYERNVVDDDMNKRVSRQKAREWRVEGELLAR
jgi:hypothetical protein